MAVQARLRRAARELKSLLPTSSSLSCSAFSLGSSSWAISRFRFWRGSCRGVLSSSSRSSSSLASRRGSSSWAFPRFSSWRGSHHGVCSSSSWSSSPPDVDVLHGRFRVSAPGVVHIMAAFFVVPVFAVFVFGLSGRASALWMVPCFSSWRGSVHGVGLSSSLRSSSASCTALVGGPLRASFSFRFRVPVIDSTMCPSWAD